MIEKDCITLENGIEYFIVDTIDNYLYLANINNPEDFCIRKEVHEGKKEYIIGLKDENEFNKALLLFEKKIDKEK